MFMWLLRINYLAQCHQIVMVPTTPTTALIATLHSASLCYSLSRNSQEMLSSILESSSGGRQAVAAVGHGAHHCFLWLNVAHTSLHKPALLSFSFSSTTHPQKHSPEKELNGEQKGKTSVCTSASSIWKFWKWVLRNKGGLRSQAEASSCSFAFRAFPLRVPGFPLALKPYEPSLRFQKTQDFCREPRWGKWLREGLPLPLSSPRSSDVPSCSSKATRAAFFLCFLPS